ncbi:hypothetical protein C8R46DRAFT_1234604 [Mycena filopes]|nr:hypothetical protein C8R46DRAFT_1234604 [Mycena filopes]
MPPRKTAAKATTKKAPGKNVAAAATSKKKVATEGRKATAGAKKAATGSKKRARSPDDEYEEDADSGDESDAAAPVKAPARKRVKKAVVQPEVETEEAEKSAPEPALSGKFDIYAMELPFLAKAYRATSSSEPQFGTLYDTILTYQAKPDFTARCVLPATSATDSATVPAAEDAKPGRLSSAALEDPMEGMPWDIALVGLQRVEPVVFLAKERKGFVTPPQTSAGAGIEGRTALEESNCGVQSAGGVFRMQRAWTGERRGKEVEVFEGYLSFDVVHSAMYKRKGHGSGGEDWVRVLGGTCEEGC